MPEIRKGVRSHSDPHTATLADQSNNTRRVTFEQGRPTDSPPPTGPGTASIAHERRSFSLPLGSIRSNRRRSSQRDRDLEEEEREAYYDSRAATQQEYRRRGSTLQSYYVEHPDLLPQLPFTFRHGFKRWKLGGYIALMVFDASVVPILLYYAMTFGGKLEGWITFAVVTAIWGGPTYIEFAVRSLRLIKKEHFFKPLGANQRWVFDITNWILVLTIATVTALLIIGAAPHDVFLRVLSMPGPAILICLGGPIFFMNLYSALGWRAPFRISSTEKGGRVLPGIYYIVEDIVAVNAGGGRPFREGWAARYNASPLFRKMVRDQSWFWSIGALLVAGACTAAVCVHEVDKSIGYGIGWGIPFLWAAIWAAISIPWIRAVMHKERTSWEDESGFMSSNKTNAPAAVAPGPLAEKTSDSLTSSGGDSVHQGQLSTPEPLQAQEHTSTT